MNTITLSYSTHRPETLGLTARIMQKHDRIFLEEPTHPDFQIMLAGKIEPEEHMLELDVGYPIFARRQYRLLQLLHQAGKRIEQVEPYLEYLVEIQEFFADGHAPAELERGNDKYRVYCCERNVTGLLIDYYKVVRGDDFTQIIKAMRNFARADAARFILRDSLRAREIMRRLEPGGSIYVEAGSIHLALHKYLGNQLPVGWSLKVHFIEREVMRQLGVSGSLFSPGDELTLSHVFKKRLSPQRENLLCGQALIYSKLVRKDEMRSSDNGFPHTLNDLAITTLVRKLSMDGCRQLFSRIRVLGTAEAFEYVQRYVNVTLRN